MTERTKTVSASSLVLDFSVYPRHRLNQANLRALREAYLAGEQLPPIDVEKGSGRVVDGFHRLTQLLRQDKAAQIAVVEHTYANDGDLFLDAVRRNARHGERLSSYDQAHCLAIANELQIDVKAIAGALAVSVDVTAEIRASRTAYDQDGKPVQIKRPFRAFAGKKMSRSQVEANEHSSGWPARFHAEQLALLLEAGAVDVEDEGTVEALERLQALLGAWRGLARQG
jgi:hypothetical protein